jgi:hypothetical protein
MEAECSFETLVSAYITTMPPILIVPLHTTIKIPMSANIKVEIFTIWQV